MIQTKYICQFKSISIRKIKNDNNEVPSSVDVLLFKFLSCCGELQLKHKNYLLCGLLAGFQPDSVYILLWHYLKFGEDGSSTLYPTLNPKNKLNVKDSDLFYMGSVWEPTMYVMEYYFNFSILEIPGLFVFINVFLLLKIVCLFLLDHLFRVKIPVPLTSKVKFLLH